MLFNAKVMDVCVIHTGRLEIKDGDCFPIYEILQIGVCTKLLYLTIYICMQSKHICEWREVIIWPFLGHHCLDAYAKTLKTILERVDCLTNTHTILLSNQLQLEGHKFCPQRVSQGPIHVFDLFK